MTVYYQISLADPNAHEFEVRMRLTLPGEGIAHLSLPAWIPGSYMIRDFARNIVEIRAISTETSSLCLIKKDKQSWILHGQPGTAELVYRIYAYDLSVRSAFFDNTRAYFNGTSLFLCHEEEMANPQEVELIDGGRRDLANWQVATGMPVVDADQRGFGIYRCENYEELIDYPVEISPLVRADLQVAGVDHQMVFVDAEGIDSARITKDVAPICAEHVAMFGELPVDSYLFMTLATSDGYGGLEHSNSTSLVCKRSDLPYQNTVGITKGYRTYLALCSHEYFHLWNVKRIRPLVFQESGLDAEVHTELLWAFEGITSYYDELALARAGVIQPEDYLDMLAPSLSRYFRNHGRHRQSVAESSFDAWTKFYKQDENAANAIVSYYNKGAFVALGLDLWMRENSDDRLCLDDLMRRLWQGYGKPGKGIPERGIESEVASLVGISAQGFFDDYIYGTVELPLEQWLAGFGVGLCKRAAANTDDGGRFVKELQETQAPSNTLQAVVTDEKGLLKVERVTNGGSAQQAGLSAGDQLLAIDGERCGEPNLAHLLNRRPAGQEVEVTYFRRDMLKQARMVLQGGPLDTCDLYWLEESKLSEEVRKRKKAWLRSSQTVD